MTKLHGPYTFRYASDDDWEKWNNVVQKSHNGTFFHSFEWIRALSRFGNHVGWKPVRIVAEYLDQKRLVGVLPSIFERKGKLVSLPFCDYGGPCIIPLKENEEERVLLGLLSTATETVGDIQSFYLVSVPSKYRNWLKNLGFKSRTSHITFILPFKGVGEDYLWSKIWVSKTKIRSNVRKARKAGLITENITNKDQLKSYHPIYLETMRKLNADYYPLKFLEALWDELYPKKLMKVFTVKHGEECIAGLVFFTWEKTVIFWGNASKSNSLYLRPNDLLFYEAINWALTHGFQFVDFGLTPIDPNDGHYKFKQKWGGKPQILYNAEKRYFSLKTPVLIAKDLVRKLREGKVRFLS